MHAGAEQGPHLLRAYTGLRWGEMAALRVGRVDFLRRRVLVSESVTPVKGVMTFGPTKGHERREVPLPRFLFGDRLDVVADAMDSARASALSGVYPPCTTGEVIELRRDAK